MTIYQPHSGFDLLENEHINLRERIAGVPLRWDSVGGVPLKRNTEPVAHAGNLGFVSYSGMNRVANLKVSQYDGTVLYQNDFTDDALNALPDGFAQWGVGSDWQVKADGIHPSGRCVEQQAAGNFWNNLYCTEYIPPADGRYIIEGDIWAEIGAGLWEMGLSLYQTAPGTFYEFMWLHDNFTAIRIHGVGNLQARICDDYAAAKEVWYRVKLVLDGQRCWGYITTLAADAPGMWINYNWGKTLTLFEAPGPLNKPLAGTIKQLWLTRGAVQDMTLKIYYDGAGAPTIDMPAWDFFFGVPYIAYMTRLVGHSLVGQSCYRYIDIPYTNGIKIVLENDVDADVAVWSQIAYRTLTPPHTLDRYTRLYAVRHTANMAPLAWEEYLNIAGRGVLHSIYQRVSNDNDVNWMEGNTRMYLDGESSPSLEATGMEDLILNSFGWQFYGCTDWVGVPIKSIAGPAPWIIAQYRIFEQDSVPFDTGLRIKWQNGQEGEGIPGGNSDLVTVVHYYLDA